VISVGWDPDPNIVAPYAVYRRLEKDGRVVSLGTVTQGTVAGDLLGINDTPSASNTLVNGAAYTYGVILTSNPAYVTNPGPEGTGYVPSTATIAALSWSNTVTAKIPPAGTKVTAPTNVKAEKITIPGSTSGEYILVTWVEPAWAEGDSPVASSYTAKLTYGGDTGLSLESPYSVSAIDTGSGFAIFPFIGGKNTVQVWGNFATRDPTAGGYSWQYYLPSDPVKVTVDVATTVLSGPTGFSILSDSTRQKDRLTLVWNKITDGTDDRSGTEADYKLYRVKVSALNAIVGDWTAVNITSKTADPASTPANTQYRFTDTTLDPNTYYGYLFAASIGNAVTAPVMAFESTIDDVDVVLTDLTVTPVPTTADISFGAAPVDTSESQFQIKFATEIGAAYKVYARKYNGPNRETTNPATHLPYGVNGYGDYVQIRQFAPSAIGTYDGITFTADGYANFLWLPTTAQRQQFDFKVEGTKSGSKPVTLIDGGHYVLKDAIIPSDPTYVGKSTADNDYYEFSLPAGAGDGLLSGEKIEIWGTKITTNTTTGVITTATASEKLFELTPGLAFTTGITGLGTDGYSY
jgi:hypothetical protein